MATQPDARRHPQAPGGRVRASRIADRGDLPALDARERVLAILRTHDDPDAFDRLVDGDLPMVHLLALESAAFGAEPAVRYSAIAALGQRTGARELNLLTDLARFGEDFYVRGHAVLALGRTGSYAHLAVIAASLDAEDSFERGAAAKAVRALTQHASSDAIMAHATAIGGTELGRRVETALRESATKRADSPRQTAAEQKRA